MSPHDGVLVVKKPPGVLVSLGKICNYSVLQTATIKLIWTKPNFQTPLTNSSTGICW